MQSKAHVISQLFLGLFVCLLGMACSADSNQKIAPTSESAPAVEHASDIKSQGQFIPQFEEVLSDSGMMKNVNPEEIITDDWTSDSPEAISDEE